MAAVAVRSPPSLNGCGTGCPDSCDNGREAEPRYEKKSAGSFVRRVTYEYVGEGMGEFGEGQGLKEPTTQLTQSWWPKLLGVVAIVCLVLVIVVVKVYVRPGEKVPEEESAMQQLRAGEHEEATSQHKAGRHESPKVPQVAMLKWRDWNGRCLTVKDGHAIKGTPVVLSKCEDLTPQAFENRDGMLVWKHTNMCITMGKETGLGWPLLIWDCDRNNRGQFFLENRTVPAEPLRAKVNDRACVSAETPVDGSQALLMNCLIQ